MLYRYVEAANADGRTPLALAVSLRHVKLAKFLRQEGASDARGLVETLAGVSGYDTSGGYSSSSVGLALTPGECQIRYMDRTGCHQTVV